MTTRRARQSREMLESWGRNWHAGFVDRQLVLTIAAAEIGALRILCERCSTEEFTDYAVMLREWQDFHAEVTF